MRRRLLVCGLGSGLDRSLPELTALGFELVVVTDAPTAAVAAAAQEIVVADPRSAGAVAQALKAQDVRAISGVMSLGFDNPPVIAALAAALGLPGLDPEIARASTEKHRRLAALRQAGLRTAAHGVAADLAQGLRILDQVGLPAIVKPVDETGSRGVATIVRQEQAPPAIETAIAQSALRLCLIEERLEGTEHTVTGLVFGGQVHFASLSDRDYSEKDRFSPHIYERGDLFPSDLPPDGVRAVFDAVAAGVGALSLEATVFNTDVLVTRDGKVVLIELTPRLPGARIATELAPLATGVRLLPNAARLALGEPPRLEDLTPKWRRGVVQRYLPSPGGRVGWVGDLQSEQAEGIHDLFWLMPLARGRRLPPYRSDADLLAGVIAVGADAAEAGRRADAALAGLPLRIDQ